MERFLPPFWCHFILASHFIKKWHWSMTILLCLHWHWMSSNWNTNVRCNRQVSSNIIKHPIGTLYEWHEKFILKNLSLKCNFDYTFKGTIGTNFYVYRTLRSFIFYLWFIQIWDALLHFLSASTSSLLLHKAGALKQNLGWGLLNISRALLPNLLHSVVCIIGSNLKWMVIVWNS